MGGSVNVLVRFSNNEKKAFRIHTSQLQEFDSPLFLDEEKFKSNIMEKYFHGEPLNPKEHDDYYSNKTCFVPYAYGALFFDLKEKKVFCCNGYKGFLSYTCINFFGKLTKLIHHGKEDGIHLYDQEEIIQSFNDVSDELLNENEESNFITIESKKIFEEPSHFYSEFYMINYAVKNNWIITVNDIKINHNNDFISLMNTILNKDIINDTKTSFDGHSWTVNDELISDGIDYIDIFPEGWKFKQDDNSYDSLNELFDYMTLNQILDESEIVLWQNFLSEIKKDEEKYNQNE